MRGFVRRGMTDPYDLERFAAARAGVYTRALSEIRSGTKRSHWMWFIFLQLAGLSGRRHGAAFRDIVT